MSKNWPTLALILVYLMIIAYWVNAVVPKHQVHPELDQYYKEFSKKVSRFCYMREYEEPNQVVVQFKKLKGNDIGQCEGSIFRYTVSIDSFMWQYLNESDRAQVVYHELGHCVLRLDHVDDKTKIMNSDLYPMSEAQVLEQLDSMIKNNCTLWRYYADKSKRLKN